MYVLVGQFKRCWKSSSPLWYTCISGLSFVTSGQQCNPVNNKQINNTQMSKMTLASCLILPAVLVLALVLLSASNTRLCWSMTPCCVDILVVLPPLAHRSLLQVTIPRCPPSLWNVARLLISLQHIACSSSAQLCSAAACVCDIIANLWVGYVCLQWRRSPGRIDQPEHGRLLNSGGPWASAQVSPCIKAALSWTHFSDYSNTKVKLTWLTLPQRRSKSIMLSKELLFSLTELLCLLAYIWCFSINITTALMLHLLL